MRLPISLVATMLLSTPAFASAFWPGTVINVPAGQSLQIRTAPSSSAAALGSATNGMSLSLTGKCQTMKAGGGIQRQFRIDGSGTVPQKSSLMSAPRTWCEVFYEISATHHQQGWARGSFISPQ